MMTQPELRAFLASRPYVGGYHDKRTVEGALAIYGHILKDRGTPDEEAWWASLPADAKNAVGWAWEIREEARDAARFRRLCGVAAVVGLACIAGGYMVGCALENLLMARP